jgi:hypothetical protein
VAADCCIFALQMVFVCYLQLKQISMQSFTKSNPMLTLANKLDLYIDRKNATAKDITDMREWLNELTFREGELDFNDTNEFTDDDIINGVQRHYDGGLKQFLIDNNTVVYVNR